MNFISSIERSSKMELLDIVKKAVSALEDKKAEDSNCDETELK